MKKVLEILFVFGFIMYGLFAYNWVQDYRGDLTIVESASANANIAGEELTGSEQDTLFAMVNVYRQENGLAPLVKHDSLCVSAQAKSDDMKQKDYFAHVSPEGYGLGYFLEADLAHYGAAENLAMVRGDIAVSLGLWQESESHNAAMLGNYNVGCIAFSKLDAVNYNGTEVQPYVVVQYFARI